MRDETSDIAPFGPPLPIWKQGWFRWFRLIAGIVLYSAGIMWMNNLASDSWWPLLWIACGFALMASFRARGKNTTRWSRAFRKYS